MIQETINNLGLKGKDKVTGFEGTISSVYFDLYGCVQYILQPAKDKDGKIPTIHSFDVQRIQVDPNSRVMPVPEFARVATPTEYTHGPAEKPECLQR